MRLAAIIHTWGDTLSLLPYCIDNIIPVVDEVIVIWSYTSNYGEVDEDIVFFAEHYKNKKTSLIRWEPNQKLAPQENERNKRNYGLSVARQAGCTHFLNMDADEFYDCEDILKEKERFTGDLKGLICGSMVYFSKPSLTIGLDTTRITFIHELTPSIRFEWNKKFPFAWDKNALRIDPTRQLNIESGVQWSSIICHHYSWVRNDYEKKIRNSTARNNIERSTIRQDLALADDAVFCKFYQKPLIRVSARFNLPDVQTV